MKYFTRISMLLFLLIVSLNMDAQYKYGTYIDTLFFNVFSASPTQNVKKFIEEYAPILLQRINSTEEWVVYPLEERPKQIIVTHSMRFDYHPSVSEEFKYGELKVYTYATKIDKQEIAGVKDVEVLFAFEKYENALSFFERLRSDLSKRANESYSQENELLKVSKFYSEEDLYDIPAGIRIYIETRGFHNDFLVVITTS